MMDDTDRLLQEQMAYYRERAAEYDELYFRRGRHDRGPEFNARWFRETGTLEAQVSGLDCSGSVLELACGSGLWTRLLASRAGSLTAVDAAPEMLALNRERVADPRVRYAQADMFTWEPRDRFDLIFLGFWLSHVPPDRFRAFWDRLASWLRPHGRVFFIDDVDGTERRSIDLRDLTEPEFTARRRLNDGREFRIVKVFYRPPELQAALEGLGWRADVRGTGEFFLYGSASPSGAHPATAAPRR